MATTIPPGTQQSFPWPNPVVTQVGMTYADNDQRTNTYAMSRFLRHVQPEICIGDFAMVEPMPMHKADNVLFRRSVPWGTTKTKAPITEGVTPSPHMMTWEDVPATINQYGGVSMLTDKAADLSEERIIERYSKLNGEQAAQTFEELLWGIVTAGTAVIYDKQSNTSRAAVDSIITITRLRLASRLLKGQGAMQHTERLKPSVDIGTVPIESSWLVFSHPDCEADYRTVAGFTHKSAYGTYTPAHKCEFGAVEDFRFLTSRYFAPVLASGVVVASAPGLTSAGGVNIDVYPQLVCGKEAFGVVPVRGKSSVQTFVIPPGTPSKSDPLGQRGFVSWKAYWAGLITNQLWQQRIETGASDLDNG